MSLKPADKTALKTNAGLCVFKRRGKRTKAVVHAKEIAFK